MIEIYDNETGDLVGEITDEQLQFLIDELEETSESDRDYYLSPATIDLLREAGAEDDLVELLEAALGDQDGVEIRWEGVVGDL